MTDTKSAKVPYDERSDDEKLESNWKKAKGLYKRQDWSACVMRVATSAEIAANIYVRQFLLAEYNLPPSFVDSLLKGANGLDGKFNRLIAPAAKHCGTWGDLRGLGAKIKSLNQHRNNVAHEGGFKNKSDAKTAYENSFAIIKLLAPAESEKLSLPFKS